MAKKVKFIKNAPLETGDKVICMYMADEFSPVAGGTPGVVVSVNNVQGENIYYVKWRSGSKLALIENVDMWKKVVELDEMDYNKEDDKEENITENILFVTTKNDLIREIKRKKY